uniref:Large ribosomal subunit protein uL14 n=1 Tax=Marmota marmota marmota TaxID=9994 RepID=A0A8C6A2R2_MARMA
MLNRGLDGSSGAEFWISLGFLVGSLINYADNTGGQMNRLPAAGVGDMMMATVKKDKPELRKKVRIAVVIQQQKSYQKKDGVFLYFEDNSWVIVNNKELFLTPFLLLQNCPLSKTLISLWCFFVLFIPTFFSFFNYTVFVLSHL